MTEAHRAGLVLFGDAALGQRAFELSLPSSQHSSLDALLIDEVLHQGGSCFEMSSSWCSCILPLSVLRVSLPAAQWAGAQCAVHSYWKLLDIISPGAL